MSDEIYDATKDQTIRILDRIMPIIEKEFPLRSNGDMIARTVVGTVLQLLGSMNLRHSLDKIPEEDREAFAKRTANLVSTLSEDIISNNFIERPTGEPN